MYKKVLYNIKKIEKMLGDGEGQYLNPKYSQCIFKKNKKKKNDRAGIKTNHLRVRKTCSLIH